ncbi:FAD-binding oxidoreductase [Haloarcula sp. S1CR25-12]|uniref:FAD-binding oxidoreductase n=1 Tax=Haloarcula saliterrae TaxID=2950534 RepID=A0ABU2F7J5_9EURY|nr:FAD-dependent oxidoreductase [Haloarcula sp. S1CR25-12]MDS0257913.1 FAD-binding oxidoreductase [Haloarcula sp. S1CR25-12]
MEVAVVGGGAVGLVVAGDLAARGTDVTLYERGALGSGATGRAAGLCYDAFADPTDAAVATRAIERYREWDLFTPCPYVWVARDERDARAVREQAAEMRALGLDVEELAPAALGERYPALGTDGLTACAVARTAGTLDPEAVVTRLAERARAAGATAHTETPATLAAQTTVETAAGTTSFDAVVVAAGPATKPLVAPLDVRLALNCYRAQALVTGPLDGRLPSLYDASRGYYWRPRDDGLLVGDGAHAVDPADCDPEADPEFVETTLGRIEAATALTPDVARAWAGCCTATPDRDPLVGPVADGLWVATGWQGHGLMRAPAIGEWLAERVRGESPRLDAPLSGSFDPTRFDGDEQFHPLGDPTADW